MIEHLKHIFYPHYHNKFHPHALRGSGLAILLISLFFLQLGYNVAQGSQEVLGFATSVKKQEVVQLTNIERRNNGVAPLATNPFLDQAAEAKAKDMFERDYWAHYTPDGSPPWSFIEEAGYEYAFAGENLARGFMTSEGVHDGWMKSPGHKANLLNDKYTEIGLAIMDGELFGEETTLVVAMYGSQKNTGPQLEVVTNSQNDSQLPVSQQYAVTQPLSPLKTLDWAAQVTIIILLTIAVIYISQHLVIRNHHLRWDRKLHQHPLFRSTLLLIAVVLMIQGSYGIVG